MPSITSIDQLRFSAPADLQQLSDAELVLEYSNFLGADPYETARYFGLDTGKEGSEFTSGVGAGLQQVQGMYYGAKAAVLDQMGDIEGRDRAMRDYNQQQAEAYLAASPTAPRRLEDASTAGEYLDWAQARVGEQIPIMGSLIGAGALAAATLPATASAAAGAAATGAATGLVGYGMGLGSLYPEGYEGGNTDSGEAFLKAFPYAAAEAAMPFAIGRILRGGRGLGTSVSGGQTIERTLSAPRAAGLGMVTEGATEGFQTGLEISMRDDLTPEEIQSRYLNAIAAGSLIGGGMSGGAASIANARSKFRKTDQGGTDLTSRDDSQGEQAPPTDTIVQDSGAERGMPPVVSPVPEMTESEMDAYINSIIDEDVVLANVGQDTTYVVEPAPAPIVQETDLAVTTPEPITTVVENDGTERVITPEPVETAVEEAPQVEADIPVEEPPKAPAKKATAKRARKAKKQTQITQEEVADDVIATSDDAVVEAAMASVNEQNDADSKLEAAVSTGGVKPTGKVTLDKRFFAGLLRMVRDVEFDAPVAYISELGVDGKPTTGVDVEATKANIHRLRRAYKALMQVAKIQKDIGDLEGNLVYGRTEDAAVTKDGKYVRKMSRALDNADKAKDYRKKLYFAVQEFVDSMQGQANAQAMIRTIKAYKESVGTFKNMSQELENYNVAFSRRQDNDYMSMGQVLDTIDFNLSTSFAAFRDGDLTAEGTQDFVSSRGIRDNQRTLEKRAKSKNPGKGKLERAAASGGIQGILNLISYKGSASGYATILSSATRYAIEELEAGGRKVTVKFLTPAEKENGVFPNYDRQSNTITLDPEASHEQILHESLHAALSWYVAEKFDSQPVQELVASLDELLQYAGENFIQVDTLDIPKTNKDNIKGVLKILSDYVNADDQQSAVLELVSYGTTMRDFKEFLKTIDSNASPQANSWVEKASRVWKKIIAVVSNMLGVSNTLANRVLDNTFHALKASTTVVPTDAGFVAGKLNMSVFGRSDSNPTDLAGNPIDIDESQADRHKLIKDFDLMRTLMRVTRVDKIPSMTAEQAGKLANLIRKEFPAFEKTISLFNTKFGLDQALSGLLLRLKIDRNQPIFEANELIKRGFENQSNERRVAMLQYLDTKDDTALKEFEDYQNLKDLADSVSWQIDSFIDMLPEDDQTMFDGKKFSDKLLYVYTDSDVASHNFNVRSLRSYRASGAIKIDSVDFETNTFLLDLDPTTGDPTLDGEFYLVSIPKVGNTRAHELVVSKEVYERRQGSIGLAGDYQVHDKTPLVMERRTRKGYEFRPSRNFLDNMNDNAAERLSLGILNTMAALSNYHASNNLLKSLANYEGGKIVFENIEEARKYFENENLQVHDSGKINNRTMNFATRSSQNFIRLSDSEEKWGDLAGKVIHAPVWHAINDMSDRQPVINLPFYNDIVRFFKRSKTTRNPGTHITNTASNFVLAYMHDIDRRDIRDAAEILYKYERNPRALTSQQRELYNLFRGSGAMLGSYSTVETKEVIWRAHKEVAESASQGTIEGQVYGFLKSQVNKLSLLQKAGKKIAQVDEGMQDLYAAEDNAFRLAAFIKKMKETDNDIDVSGRFALEAFLDYDIDAPAVKALRQTIMPFISWTYAVMPVLGKIAVNQPWKIGNVVAGLYILDAVTSAIAGDDDEMREYGPEKLGERLFGIGPRTHIRLPFLGDSENPVYYRIGDYIPLDSTFSTTPKGFMGMENFPAGLMPSGPLVSAFNILVSGIDPYTGKPITEATDTTIQKWGSIAAQMANIVTPPWMQSNDFKKLGDYVGNNENFAGQTIDASDLIISNLLGLKLVDYNRKQEAISRSYQTSSTIREYKAAMNKLHREEMRKGSPDIESLKARIEELRQRMVEDVKKINKIDEE